MNDIVENEAPGEQPEGQTPPEVTEQPMHLHKPKPVHNWRELVTEVGVIVIGILIALGLEQAIESWHERERAEVAREAIRSELRFTLAKAVLIAGMQECSEQQLVVLSEAIGSGDHAEVRRLIAEMQLPQVMSWSDAAWQAAIDSNITDQFDAQERTSYSVLYDIVNAIERMQDPYVTSRNKLRAITTSGLAQSPDARSAELTEMAAMTASLHNLQAAAAAHPQTAKAMLGLAPTKADFDRVPYADQPTRCWQAATAMRTPKVPGR